MAAWAAEPLRWWDRVGLKVAAANPSGEATRGILVKRL